MFNKKSFRSKAALILSIVLVLSVIPVSYGAAEEGTQVYGTYSTGTNVNGTGVHMAEYPVVTFGQSPAVTDATVIIDQETKYQQYDGLGMSLDESSVHNIWQLSKEVREDLLSRVVKEWNIDLFRLVIGSCDCNYRFPFWSNDSRSFGKTSEAQYDLDVEDDFELKYFSIQMDHELHIIETIKFIQELNPDVKFFASAWSAPSWMKEIRYMDGNNGFVRGEDGSYKVMLNEDGTPVRRYKGWVEYNTYTLPSGGTNRRPEQMNYLRDDCIDALADYYLKYVLAYKELGIDVYALTILNEPGADVAYSAMNMTTEQHQLLSKAIKKRFEENGIDTRLWAHDWNINDWYSQKNDSGTTINDVTEDNHYKVFLDSPVATKEEMLEINDGVALHPYDGGPERISTQVSPYIGDLKMHNTESNGFTGANLVSWFANGISTYSAWVPFTDRNGGIHYWYNNSSKLNDIYDNPTPQGAWRNRIATIYHESEEDDRYVFGDNFWKWGQFSKYLVAGSDRPGGVGATRIACTVSGNNVTGVAFENPDGETVLLLNNSSNNSTRTVSVAVGDVTFHQTLPANSLSTFRWTYEEPDDGLLPPSNPIVKTIYTADPSAHVWSTDSNKLYLYASHDVFPANGCDYMDRYHVYSTEDMVNWVDEGEIIRASDTAWGRAEEGFMWAPDAAYKDGTYYFYYPHPTSTNWGASWEVGVATSKYPDKGFIDQGYVPGATTRTDGGVTEANRRDGMIDPNIFIDDDGQAYLFTGGSQRCYYAPMGDDMMSLEEPLKRIPASQVPSYHEGPWVFKREGIYYLTYPGAAITENGVRSDQMLYCTSDNINGPWTPRGAFLGPVNTGDTSHGSVVQFKGHWYVFYHNAVVSGGAGNLRSVCVDELFFNEDGTIQKVVQTTTGPASVGSAPAANPNKKTYKASEAVLSGNAALVDAADWGQVVTGLTSGTSAATFNDVEGGLGGRATIRIRYSANALRYVRLVVNDFDWSYINLFSTGDVNSYTREAVFTVTNFKPGATNTVRLEGRGAGAFNIAQISVTPLNDYDEINSPDQAKITSITATSPLAVGCAANIRYNIEGENLAGKTLQLYMFEMDPIEVKADANGKASGVIYVSAEWMNRSTMLVLKDTVFNLSAKVKGEKAVARAPITLMPIDGIWKVYSVDNDGKLLLEFGADVSTSKTTQVLVDGKAYPAVLDGNTIAVDVDFDTLTPAQEAIGGNEAKDGTPIVIKGVKFPMFISYSFTFSTQVITKPEIKYYSARDAALYPATGSPRPNLSNNGSSPNGVCIENLSNGGTYAEWTITDVEKAGDYVFAVYYSKGDTNTQNFQVYVDGVLQGPVTLTPTGGWSTFTGYAERIITLKEGTNVIRYTIGSGSGGGGNMYQISLQRIP